MRKIRFVALLLALALLLCACGAAKTPLEQTASYLKKAAPNPGYGSLNGDWTVFGLARSGVQVAGKYYDTYYSDENGIRCTEGVVRYTKIRKDSIYDYGNKK